MSVEIEREWVTGSGLRAIALVLKWGERRVHRCGYVEVPQGSILHGKEYGDELPELAHLVNIETPVGDRGIFPIMIAASRGGDHAFTTPDTFFEVHGSITYSGENPGPIAMVGEWWFGFDCGHCDDAPIEPMEISAEVAALVAPIHEMLKDFDPDYELKRVTRDLDFVVEQCENLAQQIWMVS